MEIRRLWRHVIVLLWGTTFWMEWMQDKNTKAAEKAADDTVAESTAALASAKD